MCHYSCQRDSEILMCGHNLRNRSETRAVRALRSGRNSAFQRKLRRRGAAYLCVTAAPSNPPENRSSSGFTPLSRLIQTPQPPFGRATGGSSALGHRGGRAVRSGSAQLRAVTQRRRGGGAFSEITDFMSAYND
ncbi:hypothetical protein MHYP_G00074940 [Metynnis hypsauchen]